MSFAHKTILNIVSMVVHRKDTAKRKFEVKNYVFSERPFLKKILKIVPVGLYKKDMRKDENYKKNFFKETFDMKSH